MDFQTKIDKDSPVVKVYIERIKKLRDIINQPYLILEQLGDNRKIRSYTIEQFIQKRDELIIELNDHEKVIDLITDNTYDDVRLEDIDVIDAIEIIEEAHECAEPFGMPSIPDKNISPQTNKD